MKIKANELMPIEVADIIKRELDCIDHWEDDSGLLIKQYTREAFPQWSYNLIEALNIVFADILADEFIVNLSGGKLEIEKILILKSSKTTEYFYYYHRNHYKRIIVVSFFREPVYLTDNYEYEKQNDWLHEREIALFKQDCLSIEMKNSFSTNENYMILLMENQ
jgi:hypothetical protein